MCACIRTKLTICKEIQNDITRQLSRLNTNSDVQVRKKHRKRTQSHLYGNLGLQGLSILRSIFFQEFDDLPVLVLRRILSGARSAPVGYRCASLVFVKQ